MKKVGIAILGLGVVGSGTYKILTEHRDFYKQVHGIDFKVENVLERNRARALSLGVAAENMRLWEEWNRLNRSCLLRLKQGNRL